MTADGIAAVSDVKSFAIDRLCSAVADLSEQQVREAVAASFFADHALPVGERNLCTYAVLAAADSIYLRQRVNLWPDDLLLVVHHRIRVG